MVLYRHGNFVQSENASRFGFVRTKVALDTYTGQDRKVMEAGVRILTMMMTISIVCVSHL